MDNVFLKQLTTKKLKSNIPSDVNAPLSFLQWKEQAFVVTDNEPLYHYNQYVLNWFANRKDKVVSQTFVLRQKYLFLLEQLQTFFTEEEKNTWYNQVNFADERELLTSIPYFAKKLKDIAVYYLNLRKKLKNTKLKYNTVGTTKAIEHEVYSYLLEAFSPDNKEHSPELINLPSPNFSELQKSLVVKVDELYDDNQYFDRSPTVPLSGYVNLLDVATASFFGTKGIVLSSDNWVFNTFSLPVTGDLNTLVNQITGNIFEQTDVNLYGTFIQNFLAENKFTLNYNQVSSVSMINNIPLSAGNNFFYYPHGIVDTSLTIPGQITPVALSSLSLSGAGTGTAIKQCDTIFIKSGNTINGAWYRYVDYNESVIKMDAHIERNATTSFIFPYPGYGLSAEDMTWTGAGLTTDQEYPFLPRNIKATVQQKYWSSPLSADSVKGIYLNNTTSISAGANVFRDVPAADYKTADKIYLRNRNGAYDNSKPLVQLSGAWLYKFTETALPVSPNQPNVFLWPYDIVDTTSTTLSAHLQNLNLTDVCSPISINDLDRSYFVAASSIDTADKIYKLQNFQDNERTQALECSWLLGNIHTVGKNRFVVQDGFTALLSAGSISKFIWTGPDNTPISEVFTSINHQIDCPFVTGNPSLSSYDWQSCTCKQTYYSPLGHNGYKFTDKNSMADFIAEDFSNFSIGVITDLNGNQTFISQDTTSGPLTAGVDLSGNIVSVLQNAANGPVNFNVNSWVDLSGNTILTSPSFAWYNTYNSPTWGYGRWTSMTTVSATSATPGISNPNTLTLQYGHSYYYSRANSKTSNNSFPPYNVLKKFNTSNTQWINAQPNPNNTNWISSNQPSSLTINSGDYIKVVRQNSTTNYYVSAYNSKNFSSNQGSAWATYDVIALSNNPVANITNIFWPQTTTAEYGDQYPSISFTDLLTPNPLSSVSVAVLSSIFFLATGLKQTKTNAQAAAPKCSYFPPTSSINRGWFTGTGHITLNPLTTSVSIIAIGGGGGGGSSEEVNAGGAGGGGGSGGVSLSTVLISQGDVIYFTSGAGGAASKAYNRGDTSSGGNGQNTTVTIHKAGGAILPPIRAGGGGGGGSGWDYHGGGGGQGGRGGANGSPGQAGTNDYSSGFGGGGGKLKYPYGAGGNGGNEYDRIYPFVVNGDSGNTGAVNIIEHGNFPYQITPNPPIIVLNGKSEINVLSGSTYTELSANWYDGKDAPNGTLIAPSSGLDTVITLVSSVTVLATLSSTEIALISSLPNISTFSTLLTSNSATITYTLTSSFIDTTVLGTRTLIYTHPADTLGLAARPVKRTIRVYDPAFPPIQNSPGILQWNIVNVQTSAVQSFYNTSVVSFAPPAVGIYYIDVVARDANGDIFRIYGQSSPNALSSTKETIIPDLTAIPAYSVLSANIPSYIPTGGFLIEQPLKGWSYTNGSPQTNSKDLHVGAKPYWATIFVDKEASTNSKGIWSWGYPKNFIDGYIPHHIPTISPLKLEYGTVVDYERLGPSFWWTQPIVYKTGVGTSIWSKLNFGSNISNLSSVFGTENFKDLVTFPTTSASDILLTNNIDGTPTRVYYYALSSFTWSISTLSSQNITAPNAQLYFQAPLPYKNLSNRFYPSVASVPTLDSLYSKDDVGGYFVPQNLGSSQFVNKNFTSFVSNTSLSGQAIVEDSNIHIGGRGLTKQDQSTVYDWTENNLWMKESSTTGDLAGYVKKNLTKELQTFVPYQSNNLDKSVGLINPQSRVSPWGGVNQSQWTDLNNEPKSFTGVRNVPEWTASQVLKQNSKTADCWVSDIYGNQYGLFKQLSGVSIANRPTVYGEIWTRSNNQVVNPGYVSLSSVFSFIDSTLYSEITGSVLNIDCFFDTLMIQTPSVLIFSKINYDYQTDEIMFSYDTTRILPLLSGFKFEQTWFFTQTKEVISLFTEINESGSFVPRLYNLNLTNFAYLSAFPNNNDANLIYSSLSTLSATQIDRGIITYNSNINSYLLAYSGLDNNIIPQPFVVTFKISDWEHLTLTNIDLYKDTRTSQPI